MPPLITVPVVVLPQEKPAKPVPVSPVQALPEAFEVMNAIKTEVYISSVAPAVAIPAPTVTERPTMLTIRQWLEFAWIIGTTVFVLVAVTKALRTNFWLLRQRKQLPAEMQIGIDNLFSNVGIKTLPKVWLVDGIGQPFV